ncbi:MAG: glyceraldehyde dehydrogenase subunit beta [Desulfurococcales archaeon]|jgi:carbon-monoxide dehydrogenase medium subunit|nr:glyceraldehyde dehydrogenase subunit beta [Desulfurococcales archaeon]
MYPPRFSLIVPSTVEEALDALSRYGEEAKVLAGGHSLIPLMKLRLASPKYLIYIGKIQGLSYIREEAGKIRIGCMTTHAMIESSDLLRKKNLLLSETASKIGDLQVRNMGTIGGSLAHADPAADYPAAITALEGEIVARSVKGERVIKAQEFFKGPFSTALRSDELLVEVRVPSMEGYFGTAYEKLVFRATDFAIVGVAAVLELDRGGAIQRARVALTGVGSTPVRAKSVEEELIGKQASKDLIVKVSTRASEGLNPPSDIRASSEYRKAMAAVMTKRALLRALERAQEKIASNG